MGGGVPRAAEELPVPPAVVGAHERGPRLRVGIARDEDGVGTPFEEGHKSNGRGSNQSHPRGTTIEGIVDPGAEACRTLRAGAWSPPERAAAGWSYAWTLAGEARLFLPVVAPAAGHLVLRGYGLVDADGARRLELVVNGASLGEVSLPRTAGTVRWPVAAHQLRRGLNEVLLRVDRVVRPHDVGLGADTRTLGVCVDWLQFVATSRARGKIRHWIKSQRLTESIALGLTRCRPGRARRRATRTSQVDFTRKDGDERVLEMTISPLTDAAGGHVGALVSFTDATELVEVDDVVLGKIPAGISRYERYHVLPAF